MTRPESNLRPHTGGVTRLVFRLWRTVSLSVAAAIVVSVVPGAIAPSSVVHAQFGPIAEWRFDDGIGNVALDAAGGGHDGTLTGDATWVSATPAQGSGAIAFGGAGAVSVPTSPALEPTSLSILAWVRGTGWTVAAWAALVQKGSAGPGSPAGCSAGSWGIEVTDSEPQGYMDSVVTRLARSDGYAGAYEEGRLWDGKWHLLAFTYDAVTNVGKSYLDGVAATMGQPAPLTYSLTNSGLSIGAPVLAGCPGETGFVGSLDDLRLYDRAVSASEISAQLPAVATTTTLTFASSIEYGQVPVPIVTMVPLPSTVAEVDVLTSDNEVVARTYLDPVTGHQFITYPALDQPWSVGDHSATAHFLGGGQYTASTSASAIFQVTRITTTLRLFSQYSRQLSIYPINLTAMTDQTWDPGATVKFYEMQSGGGSDLLATVPVDGGSYLRAFWTIPSPSLGNHEFTAVLSQTPTNTGASAGPIDVDVVRRPTELTANVSGTRQTHHQITVDVDIHKLGQPSVAVASTGTVKLIEGSTVIATASVASGHAVLTVASLPQGPHDLTVKYLGDHEYGASNYALSVPIGPDIVDADNVGVSYTTFYPVADGYRDVLAIGGLRNEPIAVAVKVTNGAGVIEKSFSAASATGQYSFDWSGRNGGGMLPAGQYLVTQTLTDSAGTRTVVKSTVTLSPKKIVYKTVALGKSAQDFDAKASSGRVTNLSGGGIKLTAQGGPAAVGWAFTLPKATLYKAVAFRVYAAGGRSVPPNLLTVQNFSICPNPTGNWSADCFEPGRSLGNDTTASAWYSLNATRSRDRLGRLVRGAVFVYTGSVTVGKVQIKVTYGILK